jgi:exodeoxyribonuclease VII large subunit
MTEAVFPFVSPQQADKPYTVSDINEGVRLLVESGNSLVWVEGEISNFKRASSGHCYLKLKDTASQIPAVVWKSVAEALPFDPEDGMQVIVIASLRVYARGGYYQLDIHRMQPAGRGVLFAAFEKLKSKLEAEGLFAQERKKKLPAHIIRLGVITSKQGAAIRDILKVAWSRSPGTDIVLIDVPVQGDASAPAIVQAIADMNMYGNVDAIIVGRGGGSLEDLWAFNEESVARAIASSALPVISAVGHEIDFTIADFVADVRAATPSSAAEMAIPDDAANYRYYSSCARSLIISFNRYYEHIHDNFSGLARRPVLARVARIVSESRQTHDMFVQRYTALVSRLMQQFRDQCNHGALRLNALSPLAVMERGYSVVSKNNGTTVVSDKQIHPGEIVCINFHEGSAHAEIQACNAAHLHDDTCTK